MTADVSSAEGPRAARAFFSGFATMSHMEIMTAKTELELAAVVETLLHRLEQCATECAAVLALYGDLGAGKTAITKMMAGTLGAGEPVTSPTFVIMKEYNVRHGAFDSLVHIDAYRLDTEAELQTLHIDHVLDTPRTLVVIEWADKVESLLPPHTVRARLDADAVTEERTITITYGD